MLIKHVRDSTPRGGGCRRARAAHRARGRGAALPGTGHVDAEIAKALIVSEGTVKAHLGRMMSKWHLRDRVQILVTAAHAGLVSFR